MPPLPTRGNLPTLPADVLGRLIRPASSQPAALLYHPVMAKDEDWIKTLEDGRKVKFTYQALPGEAAFITAQIAGNKVVYSIVLTEAKNPLSHDDVEVHFKAELSKR